MHDELPIIPMNCRRWSAEDRERLIRLFGTMPVDELAAEFGRTMASVQAKAQSLGLRRRKPVA